MSRLKELSRNAKIAIAVCACIVVIAAAVGGSMLKKIKNAPQVVITSAELGSVVQNYSTTAQIKSKEKTVYEALDGVIVNTVDVKVGDVVNEGTLLATFDTSALGESLASKRKAWQNAKTAYEEAVQAAKEAEVNLPKLKQQIADLEKKIEQDKVSGGTATTAPASNSSSGGVLDSLLSGILGGGDLSSLMGGDQMSSLFGSGMSGLSDQSQLVQLQAQVAMYEVITGETYLNSKKDQMENAQKAYDVYKAAMDMLDAGWTADCYGIVSEVNLVAGQRYTNETEKSGGLDFSSLAGLLNGSADYSSLIGAIAGFSSSANNNSALVIENYNNLYMNFTLGKYDLKSVRLGQAATITYLDKTYTGRVTYISAVAKDSDSLDISSMVGSLTGGGGSSTGAQATVSIDNPDSGIVIGFDADLEIETGRADNVIVVPVECLRVSNGEKFVYIYNPETKKIEMRMVTVGLAGDDYYEIVSGIGQGEQVVKVIKGAGTVLENNMRVKVVEK